MSYEIGNFENAVDDYSSIIEIDPNSESAYYSRALNYFYLAIYSKSIADYNKVLELDSDSNDDRLYLYRGCGYMALDNPSNAVVDFTNAIRINKNNSIYYKYRALAYFLSDNIELAIKDISYCIKLPNHENIYTYLINLVLASKTNDGNTREAISLISDYIQKTNIKSWDKKLGEIFINNSDFTELIENAGNNKELLCETYTYIGYYYLFNNKTLLATKYFEKSIDTGIKNYIEYILARHELKFLQR